MGMTAWERPSERREALHRSFTTWDRPISSERDDIEPQETPIEFSVTLEEA